jgi:hypothetical protein
MTKMLPSAVVAALIAVLTAVTATSAPAKPGPGEGGTPPAEQTTTVLSPPVTTAAPATTGGAPATGPSETKEQAPGRTTAPGQAKDKKDKTAGTDEAAPGRDGAGPPAPPVLGRSMAVRPLAGAVQVRLPERASYVALAVAGSVPTGTTIDARHGRVELHTAVPGGRTQTATFWGAVFEVRQARDGRGMTDLVLKGARPAGCPAPRRAVARMARFPVSSGGPSTGRSGGLWAKDKRGRFRTHGRNSVATVRGTRWLTRETCAGTLTRVTEGAVAVRDKRRHKTVVVRAGHSYLARDAR